MLKVRSLPPGFEGLRIAFLTDIHHSLLVPADDVQRAVALANSLEPDLIVLGGDYVTGFNRAYMNPVAELLAPLHAPLGVVAILGNHDDDREMPAALSRRHIEVLKDARTQIQRRGDVLELAGIQYWTRREAEIQKVLRHSQGPVLLLAHDPRRLLEASMLDVPAVLSGHTHGGQIVIPGLGAPAARKFPVTAGLGSQGGTTIFVSRGIGTVYVPVRINCPPEVALVTLRRQFSV
ncbi:MAG TPA: metallophosphoesterase [Vicinamibacterales bacterium]|nr:metallophosphoesterase [Vicinamibacterales bacterium]